MRKFYFLTVFITIGLVSVNQLIAQQVAKKYVVVEMQTGTWCSACPGAALGADDLVENGHSVAIIENHYYDNYQTDASLARINYYGSGSYPTAFFNGANGIVGGGNQSVYSNYLPLYNNAIAVMSDFTLDLSYTNTDQDYNFTIEVIEPGNYVSENLTVHFVLTETHIQESWQGLSELNFVNRLMLPDSLGTLVTGGTETVNLSFTADPTWDIENCEIIAFIQDVDTKEILQADKLTLAIADGTNNISFIETYELLDLCPDNNTVSPSIIVRNIGADDITSLTIDYDMNSGATTGTYTWTGNAIIFNSYKVIDLEPITFDLLTTNSLDMEIVLVNGAADDDNTNNTGNVIINEVPRGVNVVDMVLRTDAYGSECRWNVKNPIGAILYSGGPYGNFQTINEQFVLGFGCYTFNIIDTYGDGGGPITLTDTTGVVLYHTDGTYGPGYSQKFITEDPTISINNIVSNIKIYPNPSNGIFTIELNEVLNTNIEISDISGKLINNFSVNSKKTSIDLTNYAKGVYFIKIMNNEIIKIEKIIVK